MKNDATTHDKIALVISIVILVCCGIGTYGGLTASMQWPKGLVFLIGIAAGATVWLVGFALGVVLRAPRWNPVFPPYQLMGMATLPAFVIAIIVGSFAGKVLFDTSLAKSAGASFLGYIEVAIAMHFLFLLHAPFTKQAVRLTHNPNIMTVDSHRYLWLFPAIGVLILFLLAKRLAPPESETIRHIAVTAAIAVSTIFAGFGSGYIP